MRPRVAAVMVMALMAGACGGPPDPLDVGVKELPSEIVLGSPESGAPAPAPAFPAVPVLVGPGVPPSLFTPAPERREPPRAEEPPPVPCPPTDPLAAPRLEAKNRIASPPPEGPLPYRVNGEFSVSGADPRSGRFPPDSVRTVGRVVNSPSGFTYEVAASLAGTVTTTGYQVITSAAVPGEAGFYVTFVDTKAPSGATARFRPPLPMKLLEFPIVAGNRVTAAGTDPISATTVSWTTSVGPKVRVAACGTPLDAITVDLVGGRVDGPETNVDFSAKYSIGTQFGGLLLADSLTVQGREGLDTVSRKIDSIISTEPGRNG